MYSRQLFKLARFRKIGGERWNSTRASSGDFTGWSIGSPRDVSWLIRSSFEKSIFSLYTVDSEPFESIYHRSREGEKDSISRVRGVLPSPPVLADNKRGLTKKTRSVYNHYQRITPPSFAPAPAYPAPPPSSKNASPGSSTYTIESHLTESSSPITASSSASASTSRSKNLIPDLNLGRDEDDFNENEARVLRYTKEPDPTLTHDIITERSREGRYGVSPLVSPINHSR